jgi:hypothetical protein
MRLPRTALMFGGETGLQIVAKIDVQNMLRKKIMLERNLTLSKSTAQRFDSLID